MRKPLRFAPLLLVFLLTSCIDYVQSVTYKDGKYQLYYKVTLSKMLFAMADENPEDIFDDFDEDALADFPESATVDRVNTDLEVGAEFSLSISPRTTDENEKALLPKTTGNKYYIPFLLGSKEAGFSDSLKSGNGDTEPFTKAILSSAKCRVLISKSVITKIETAYFAGRGGQNYSIPVFDYGDSHCLEIPFIVLFETGMYKFDRIVVLKES